ncbi:hypothetical protein C8R48DRAFT_349213 [Suillus tomentosus]|nr:hypothetical protein C8R48DRAFT_349213 [Suillus tomentosus]
MSNLPGPPPSSAEKLTVKKVLRVISTGILLLSNIINGFCIAVVFIYIGSTIPVLTPYADYVAVYMLGARTIFPACVFCVGCYWCCLRLVAPKQAGSSISEWGPRARAQFCEALSPSNGKLGRAGRIYFVTTGVLNAFSGLYRSFCFWKEPWFSVRGHVMSVIFLILGAWSIQIAYVGRVSRRRAPEART